MEIHVNEAGLQAGTFGLAVDGGLAMPPFTPGRHILTDPDGRTVEVHAT
ncbi:hypothetical protein [Streptomyces sp. NPDC048659]